MFAAIGLAEIFSVAATYAAPERPLLWQASILLARLGTILFPTIGKFATDMAPLLQPIALIKVQTIITLFMLAGGLAFIVSVPYLALMPYEERIRPRHLVKQFRPYEIPPLIKAALVLPFAMLLGAESSSGGQSSLPTSRAFSALPALSKTIFSSLRALISRYC